MRKGSIAITLGDAAGIGPEIVKAALASGRLDPGFRYVVVGEEFAGAAGLPSDETSRAAMAALEEAARMALAGEVEAVVTGPVSKARIQKVGFEFPGQTEFFAARSGVEDFAMLLTGGGLTRGTLTVALVTAHVPLSEVAGLLTEAEIVRVGSLLVDFLLERNGEAARVAVAGLNPHAGEGGTMGMEEMEKIGPAVEGLRERWRGRAVFEGPVSPDTVFYRAVNGGFNGVLCMYHDQGLIPLKLHAFDSGVNVTLGLPFVRTSPDHGTAFEIAGRGVARPGSMIAAINLAAELAEKRMAAKERLAAEKERLVASA